ncbi:hypothetical protein BLOT_001197 [Blomia tropicalis]|nr:hypothetical protein BLOT_001197 [Blomia tropicalis]
MQCTNGQRPSHGARLPFTNLNQPSITLEPVWCKQVGMDCESELSTQSERNIPKGQSGNIVYKDEFQDYNQSSEKKRCIYRCKMQPPNSGIWDFF